MVADVVVVVVVAYSAMNAVAADQNPTDSLLRFQNDQKTRPRLPANYCSHHQAYLTPPMVTGLTECVDVDSGNGDLVAALSRRSEKAPASGPMVPVERPTHG